MTYLIPPAVAAQRLGLTVGNLAQMRYVGTGPTFVKVSGKKVAYTEADILSWIESCKRNKTGGEA